MKRLFTLLLCVATFTAFAQEDLLSILNDSTDAKSKKQDVTATFKATRIVSGQSVEVEHGGVLNFVIQHRFGPTNGVGADNPFQLSKAAHEFFGLDLATLRLGFDMGITNHLNAGIGRSSVNKTYDGYLKYKIAKQKIKGFPVTITAYSAMAIQTDPIDPHPNQRDYFSSRLSYTNQLLIGSRVTPSFSFQLSPTIVHRNIVDSTTEKNDVYAIGIGARQKLSKRVSLNAEYFYVLPNQLGSEFHNSLSIGFDIETGGHVFQLHLTNSQQMNDKGFITETRDIWQNGGIHIGFNISRVFTLYQWEKNW